MMLNGTNINEFLPIISLFIFAGYKLLPALQEIYSSITRIKFSWPSFEVVYESISNSNKKVKKVQNKRVIDQLHFNENIVIENISYKYPKSNEYVLKDIDIKIEKGQKIGFIGKTGSGKSTLIDIIISLLVPNKGNIKIDNKYIDSSNIEIWQSKIGYVSQNIFLADDSVTSNIAFGIRKEDIDLEKVMKCAQIAQIHDYIINEMEKGYDTLVGQNG